MITIMVVKYKDGDRDERYYRLATLREVLDYYEGKPDFVESGYYVGIDKWPFTLAEKEAGAADFLVYVSLKDPEEVWNNAN